MIVLITGANRGLGKGLFDLYRAKKKSEALRAPMMGGLVLK